MPYPSCFLMREYLRMVELPASTEWGTIQTIEITMVSNGDANVVNLAGEFVGESIHLLCRKL